MAVSVQVLTPKTTALDKPTRILSPSKPEAYAVAAEDFMLAKEVKHQLDLLAAQEL